jgi:hypothetical protein
MQVTCDHFTIGFVEKNRYFKKQNADAENQAGAAAHMARPSVLKPVGCPAAEISRAATSKNHRPGAARQLRQSTRIKPGVMILACTRVTRQWCSARHVIFAKDAFLLHSSIFFARIIGLLKINTSSN